MVQDPVVHHNFSPYSAFDNNPVFWADPSGADAVYNWETGKYMDGDKEVSFEEALAGYGVNDNDDIIFKDKKGNKLGTYKDGKDEITNITMPIDDFGSSPNLDLNKATLNLLDVDVIGLSLSGEITYGIGAGMGQEFIYFLDGKNKNQLFAYSFASITLGVGGEGLSINAIAANFLGADGLLTSDDYLGTFNYYSGSSPVAGVSYFWGNSSNSVELWPGMSEWWDSDYKQTWSGVSISAPGPNLSATVGTAQYVYTPLLNNLLKKWGLQK